MAGKRRTLLEGKRLGARRGGCCDGCTGLSDDLAVLARLGDRGQARAAVDDQVRLVVRRWEAAG
jgi:hypothetical protein